MSMSKQLLKLLLILFLLVTYSFVVNANSDKPIISVFSIKMPKLKLKFSKIMKNSVLHSLNKRGFLTQDGNKVYRFFDKNNQNHKNQNVLIFVIKIKIF